MYRSEEIPKTEPAEKIIEAKIEHVSGIGIYWYFIKRNFLMFFLINKNPLLEDVTTNSQFELSPIEISEIIQSLIENPGANFGATAKKFSAREVFRVFFKFFIIFINYTFS